MISLREIACQPSTLVSLTSSTSPAMSAPSTVALGATARSSSGLGLGLSVENL